MQRTPLFGRTAAIALGAAIVLSALTAGASIGTAQSVVSDSAGITAARTYEDPIATQLESALVWIDQAVAAVERSDWSTARQAYGSFDEAWDSFEDLVKAESPETYKAIEDAMADVVAALINPAMPNQTAAFTALDSLRQVIRDAEANLGG